MRLVIVTGMSGAGKSTALKMLEDMGYFCVDNLPIPLLPGFVEIFNAPDSSVKKVALGIDVRGGQDFGGLQENLEDMDKKEIPYEILFLDAHDDVLVKRYKETRRSHPLARSGRVEKGIALEREKLALKDTAEDIQPDFAGKEYLLERQLKPEARRDIIEKLRQASIQPTAMMDISDGLSSELLHICTQSKVGCRVYEEHIPLDYQTAVMAEELNMNVTTCALNGGEDYELLFTVPIADHEKVSEMEGVKLIGHITKPELGCALITRDGQEFELKAQGWNPLKETENGQE